MVNYGLKDKVAVITGANNPWGIGAATALAFAREGAKVVLVYKKLPRIYDEEKTHKNGEKIGGCQRWGWGMGEMGYGHEKAQNFQLQSASTMRSGCSPGSSFTQ